MTTQEEQSRLSTHEILSKDELAALPSLLKQSVLTFGNHQDTYKWMKAEDPTDRDTHLLGVPSWITELSSQEREKLFLTDQLHTIAQRIKTTGTSLNLPIMDNTGIREIGRITGGLISPKVYNPSQVGSLDKTVLLTLRLGPYDGAFSLQYNTFEAEARNRATDPEKGYASVSIVRFQGSDERDEPISIGGIKAILNGDGHIIDNDIRYLRPYSQ